MFVIYPYTFEYIHIMKKIKLNLIHSCPYNSFWKILYLQQKCGLCSDSQYNQGIYRWLVSFWIYPQTSFFSSWLSSCSQRIFYHCIPYLLLLSCTRIPPFQSPPPFSPFLPFSLLWHNTPSICTLVISNL